MALRLLPVTSGPALGDAPLLNLVASTKSSRRPCSSVPRYSSDWPNW